MKHRSLILPLPFTIIAILVFLCLTSSVAMASFADYQTRPGTINHTLTLCDGIEVVLDSVVIRYVSSPYIYVSDPWDVSNTLPVYANVDLKPWLAAEITGRTATIGGKRIIIASWVRLYTDCRGRPFYMLPKFRVPLLWDWMLDVPLGGVTKSIPSPSDMESMQTMQMLDSEPLTAPEGTIAAAKLDGGDVTLSGKVVTAVSYNEGAIDHFYIEETDRSCGIRVEGTPSLPIQPGSVVTVAGSVVSGDTNLPAESHIHASAITLSGWHELIRPLCMCQRSTAGGEFGLQQALYVNVTKLGAGLNAVGSLIRVAGEVTWSGTENSLQVHYIDDGSGLARTDRDGIKIVYAADSGEPTRTVGSFLCVTGVLGAEMTNDIPVPVVRVYWHHNSNVIHVKPSGSDANDGSTWELAKATVQNALDTAVSDGKHEVWVAAGTYEECITLADSVALYGGFAGTEEYREERNWNTNVTILDGNQGGSVVTSPEGATETTVIDGFTIRSNYNGSGIYCFASSPTIVNNTITYNSGGIMCLSDLFLPPSSPMILNNTITDNTGSGIYCNGGAPTITHNTITNNSTASGGGIYCDYSSPIILNNIISGNTATQNGGGIYCSHSSPTIANNVITDNSALGGSGIYCSSSSPAITNNTISDNTGSGISCSNSSTTISNNIVAFNSSGISKGLIGGTPVLRNNCVYNPGGANYTNLSSGLGDIQVDPTFMDRANGNYHIRPDSPCRDAGYNDAAQPGWVDMDSESRILMSHVDIGADEVSGVTIILTPVAVTASCSSSVTLTAQVVDCGLQQPVAGRRVDVTVNAGSITSISPDGHLDTPPVSGWGITDSNGNITITVLTPAEPQPMTVTASTTTEIGLVSAQSIIDVGQRRVGFLYDLCMEGSRSMIDPYLTRIDNQYYDVIYDRLDDIESGIDSSYSVVFVAMPVDDLSTSELNALSAFVQSGRDKRVVLIGEHNYENWYTEYNGRLNTVAAAIGMSTRFSEGTASYEPDPDWDRHCEVNSSNYLMEGVEYLWDAYTDTFVTGWESYARPLAYIHVAPALPWILEEDTATAGSRIAIHDSSMMTHEYDDTYDTVPDKNFKFVHNLCTIFPQ